VDHDDSGPIDDAEAAGPRDVDGDVPDDRSDASTDPIEPGDLAAAIEAILFVVDAPLTLAAIAAAVQAPTAVVETAVAHLRAGYDERGAGIELRDVGGGIRLYTRPAYAPQVEMFLHDGQRTRLTQAALETLAVIAYRQPVTRSRISAIRGVNVDGVVRTLLSRGLIVEVGADAETGGDLFRTSELFLEKMGLQTLTELPSLAPLLPELDGLDIDEL
jgi:segregation and condensation protein B